MISVILPTYNEAGNIRIIIPEIFSVLDRSSLQGEIVVVDDDSPDGTAESANKMKGDRSLKVYIRKNERGLATAVMKGFELASGDIIVVMDADLSHPVEKIPEMVKPVLAGNCDLTVGSRYIGQGGFSGLPFTRRFMSRFSGFLAKGLTDMTDPTSGFMAVRKKILDGVKLDPVGWKIVLEIAVKTGTKFMEIPIEFSDRSKGRSKLDAKVKAQYIAHLLRLYRFKYAEILGIGKNN